MNGSEEGVFLRDVFKEHVDMCRVYKVKFEPSMQELYQLASVMNTRRWILIDGGHRDEGQTVRLNFNGGDLVQIMHGDNRKWLGKIVGSIREV
jgi:hypothetical protein